MIWFCGATVAHLTFYQRTKVQLLSELNGKWWNWHTRQTQNLLPKGLRVQVSPYRMGSNLDFL